MVAPASSEGLFARARTLFSRRPSTPRSPRFAERLDGITGICIEALKKIQEDENTNGRSRLAEQHSALAMWAAECCIIFQVTLLGIRNPESFQNKDLLKRLQTLAPHSSFARFLVQTKTNQYVPIPKLIFEDASHSDCKMCAIAKTNREKSGERFFREIFPKRSYVGLCGVPLREEL